MFLTANTYRQAAWTPDQSWSGQYITNFSSSSINQLITTQTGAISSQTTITTSFAAASTAGSSSVGLSVTRVPQGTMAATGTTARLGITSSFWSSGSLRIVGGGSTITAFTTQAQTVTAVTSSAAFTISGLFGTATSGNTSSTGRSTSSLQTLKTIDGAHTTTSTTISSSTLATAGGSTAATTSFTIPAFYASSINSVVTTTVASTISDIVSTTTTTSTAPRWSLSGSTDTATSTTCNTTISTLGTAAITANDFTTVTIATPTWYGWLSDLGTALLATANADASDLPAWISGAGPETIGLWNYGFGTQTTIWQETPAGQNGPIATSAFSLFGTANTISIGTGTAVSLFGTYVVTTTSTLSVVAAFTDSSDPNVSTAGLPLRSTACTVTGYQTISFTTVIPIETPINSFVTTSQVTTGGRSSTITHTITFSSLSIANFGKSITFSTTFTVPIWVSGYSTASVGTAFGDGGDLRQTSIITSPVWSLVTSTTSALWFFDWSCPTIIFTSSISTSTSGSTNAGGSPISSTSITASGSAESFSFGGFTQNTWTQPGKMPNASIVINNIPQSSEQFGNVGTWNPMPSMQGFVGWANTNVTYQGISGPAAASVIPVLRLESGGFQSFNFFGCPVTTTATGLWALAPSPVTTTSTYSTTSGTSTVTHTFTSISCFTFGSSASGTSTTHSFSIVFPTNLVESNATIYTYGSSGTVSSGLTTSSSTLPGLTLQNSVTSVFVEQYSDNTRGSTRGFPGVGGFPKITSKAETLYVRGAGVSVFGFLGATSNTWSSADPNFFAVVLGGGFTTTSSTTTDLGIGSFAIYTIPGQGSVITSPAVFVTTENNRYAPAVTTGTRFWLAPDPFFTPNQTANP